MKTKVSEFLLEKFFKGLNIENIEEFDTINYKGDPIYYVAYHFENFNYFKQANKINKFLTKKFGANSIKKDDVKIVGSWDNPGYSIFRIIINGDNVKKIKKYIKKHKSSEIKWKYE
jgi:hypothetical protein